MGSNPWRFCDSVVSNQLRHRYKLSISSSSLAYIWNVIRAANRYFQNAAIPEGPACGNTSYDVSPHSIYRRILVKTILTWSHRDYFIWGLLIIVICSCTKMTNNKKLDIFFFFLSAKAAHPSWWRYAEWCFSHQTRYRHHGLKHELKWPTTLFIT